MKTHSKVFIIVLLVFLLFVGSYIKAPAEGALRAEGYNVLFLNIELLRADRVGLINPSAKCLTPNIDSFFKDSIVFANASAPSGSTYLSAVSTATATESIHNPHSFFAPPHQSRPHDAGGGRWFVLQSIKEDGQLWIDRVPTIAEVLKDHGYNTISVNDWIHSGKGVYLDRGFDDYSDVTGYAANVILRDQKLPFVDVPSTWDTIYLFEDQLDIVLSKMEDNQKDRFLLYYHPNALHYPFMFSRDYFDKITIDSPEKRLIVDQISEDIVSMGPPPFSEVMREYRKKAKRGEVKNIVCWAYDKQTEHIDNELGRLFSFLLSSGLIENTIVVLYSNHGVDLYDHNTPYMGIAYQSCVHVPLLIRHPQVHQEIRIEDPVSLVDLAPTLYEMLGVKINHEISGTSMMSLVFGGESERKYFFGKDIQMEYVREGDWKLITKADGRRELYNLSEDPKESKNLYRKETVIAGELERALIEEKNRKNQLRGHYELLASPEEKDTPATKNTPYFSSKNGPDNPDLHR